MKNKKNTTIEKILPFIAHNIGPSAAGNGGGGETMGKERQIKKRSRKHENLLNLTFVGRF